MKSTFFLNPNLTVFECFHPLKFNEKNLPWFNSTDFSTKRDKGESAKGFPNVRLALTSASCIGRSSKLLSVIWLKTWSLNPHSTRSIDILSFRNWTLHPGGGGGALLYALRNMDMYSYKQIFWHFCVSSTCDSISDEVPSTCQPCLLLSQSMTDYVSFGTFFHLLVNLLKFHWFFLSLSICFYFSTHHQDLSVSTLPDNVNPFRVLWGGLDQILNEMAEPRPAVFPFLRLIWELQSLWELELQTDFRQHFSSHSGQHPHRARTTLSNAK